MINISSGMKIESSNSYSIMEKIGEGNYAIVYKAKHEELGRIAALKFLKKGKEAISELKKEGWVQEERGTQQTTQTLQARLLRLPLLNSGTKSGYVFTN